MKKITLIKIMMTVAVVLAMGSGVFSAAHALAPCQGYATASYGGGSSGSGSGQCSYASPNSKIIVEMRNCSTNATVVNTPKTTFCYNALSCSGASNTFTRAAGQKYYSYVTYTPDRSNPSWAFVSTSACK